MPTSRRRGRRFSSRDTACRFSASAVTRTLSAYFRVCGPVFLEQHQRGSGRFWPRVAMSFEAQSHWKLRLILEAAGTFPNVTGRERLATVPSAKMAAGPGPDRGGGHRVPPPPKCLHELGRSLGIPEDAGGVDGRRQAPPYQRVSIRSRAPSAV